MNRDAKIRELLLMVSFHEKSTRVMKNLRAQFPNARNREFSFWQKIHASIEVFCDRYFGALVSSVRRLSCGIARSEGSRFS